MLDFGYVIISVMGSIMIGYPYLALIMKFMSTDDIEFYVWNILGRSTFLASISYWYPNAAFIIVQIVFIALSIFGLARTLKQRTN